MGLRFSCLLTGLPISGNYVDFRYLKHTIDIFWMDVINKANVFDLNIELVRVVLKFHFCLLFLINLFTFGYKVFKTIFNYENKTNEQKLLCQKMIEHGI